MLSLSALISAAVLLCGLPLGLHNVGFNLPNVQEVAIKAMQLTQCQETLKFSASPVIQESTVSYAFVLSTSIVISDHLQKSAGLPSSTGSSQ